MRAAVCKQYGPPEVLEIKSVPFPDCKSNEILIKIMATSVNSGDTKIRSLAGKGFLKLIMQLVLGFYKPRKSILGTVYAGIVIETGKNTGKFRVGERVFGLTGFKFGTYAQYISVKENSVVTQIPINASFEEAAALPFGWHTAIYFLKKAGIEKLNQPKVLIYGATGSVGTAAVQFAQCFKANITVVCSSEGKKMMHDMGVNDIICYDQQDFTKSSQKKFDIIFDAVGKTCKSVCKPIINKGGSFVTVGGLDVAAEVLAQLDLIKNLFEEGKCKAIIDKSYPFSNIVDAHRYVDTGRKKGNVVVKIA